MTKKFWSSEKIMSLSAMIIGLGTLIVFIYQTDLIRKQQYMSVYPYLTFGYSQNNQEFVFYIENKGIGPAIIESVNIQTPSGNNYSNISNLVVDLMKKHDPNHNIKFIYSSFDKGEMISEKEKIEFLKIINPDYNKLDFLFKFIQNKGLVFEIIYKSIYDEKWEISNNDLPPIKIE